MNLLLALLTCVRIGNGTVAPLHEQKLLEHNVQTIGIIDTDLKKKEAVLSQGVKWFESYEEAYLAKPLFWDICTPPEHHFSTMKKIAKLDPNAYMVVEKPICMSQEIEALEEFLKTFQGKIVVNENYLSSDVTQTVQKIASQELKSTTRIVVEMDKNRTQDFKRGRYVDPEGAFKYEGTHMVTILQSLLGTLPSTPDSVVYEDLSPSFPLQGSADITYHLDSLDINLYSSMKGEIKNRFPPVTRISISEEETAPRYRVVAIEGLSQDNTPTTIVGFYEPIEDKPRGVGEVVVLKNGAFHQSLGTIPDSTMGKHLEKAVDYFTGKTTTNPCPPETGIAIVKLLDSMLPQNKHKR